MNGRFFIITLLLILLAACHKDSTDDTKVQALSKNGSQVVEHKEVQMPEKVIKTDEEWQRLLTPQQHVITRRKGTERPFTGKYFNFTREGIYRCVCCANNLFSSDTKYDAGTGWPSFWAPISESNIKLLEDPSPLVKGKEVLCNRCDAHLGHVFHKGPPPTGLRYSINSIALQFVEKK
jgi:peptide-methionine (R)-S-oxide reductase